VVGLEALGAPLPGETALISAGIYAGATHRLQPVGVVISAVAGAVVGYSLGFLIGSWGGYRLVVRYGAYIRLDQPKVKIARYLFQRQGGKVIFFGRFVPILRAYGAFLAGTSRMPWRRFSIFNAAGAIIWASLYGGAAYFFGDEVQRASTPLAVAFGAIAVVAIVAAVVVIRRQEHRLEAIAEAALPGPLEGYPGGGPL
jgi:membrane protein DedA with SNARE-associated domain